MYYDGKLLSENFLSRRKKTRYAFIISNLILLESSFPDGISTSDLWLYLVKNGYYYDVRTLHKDLVIIESDGLIVGDTVFGGKGKGTVKFWKITTAGKELK